MDLTMPVVSVVVPCFNDGAFLVDALQSVYDQTLPDWEVVVVDDGSTDEETKSILARINQHNVRVLHTSNRGPAAARNYGIGAASGKYILPLDADDKVDPRYLRMAVEVMEAHPEFDIVYCRARLFGLRTGSWALPPFNSQTFVLENPIFATALFRRTTWERIGGYDERMVHGIEDYDFWMKIISRGGGVYRIEEELFMYRIKSHSRTAKLKDRSVEDGMFAILLDNNLEYFQRRENIHALFFSLRRRMIDESLLLSSFLWRYLFRPLVRMEVQVLERFKRALGR